MMMMMMLLLFNGFSISHRSAYYYIAVHCCGWHDLCENRRS